MILFTDYLNKNLDSNDLVKITDDFELQTALGQ